MDEARCVLCGKLAFCVPTALQFGLITTAMNPSTSKTQQKRKPKKKEQPTNPSTSKTKPSTSQTQKRDKPKQKGGTDGLVNHDNRKTSPARPPEASESERSDEEATPAITDSRIAVTDIDLLKKAETPSQQNSSSSHPNKGGSSDNPTPASSNCPTGSSQATTVQAMIPPATSTTWEEVTHFALNSSILWGTFEDIKFFAYSKKFTSESGRVGVARPLHANSTLLRNLLSQFDLCTSCPTHPITSA